MTPHEYLNTFTNFEAHLTTLNITQFDLSRFKELLSLLDDPQEGMRVIHVAGTKGKGSTCAFISYILANAGYRVGLYTSPHLHHVNERIRVLDKGVMASLDDFYGSISDADLEKVIVQLRPEIAALANRGMELTYFEVLTAVALVHFKRQRLDYVVLETGLGGRLDATNAVPATVAVITPISLDHMHLLGDTIAQIAVEKAGIIKSSSQQVIIAPQEEDALEILLERCGEFGIEPVVVDAHYPRNMAIGLKGEHQRLNAAVAAKAIEALKVFGSPAFAGLVHQAVAVTRWAGRFEVLGHDPLVIADGAHNAASARALVKTVRDEYPQHEVTLIMGISRDKDITSTALELKPLAERVILTKSAHPRAHAFDAQEAEELFHGKPWSLADDIPQALKIARAKAGANDVIVVTGSIFITAEARKAMAIK